MEVAVPLVVGGLAGFSVATACGAEPRVPQVPPAEPARQALETVAANAIAIVGTNPVSGMTLMTLILASIILVATGLSGTAGMVSALIIGGVVCTALSMAGGFITDLKIGYWLGSTPVKQESWKFLGTLVSAATVGGVILILNQTYGFTSGQLAAPQANAMAAVIEPLMSGAGAPWALLPMGSYRLNQ